MPSFSLNKEALDAANSCIWKFEKDNLHGEPIMVSNLRARLQGCIAESIQSFKPAALADYGPTVERRSTNSPDLWKLLQQQNEMIQRQHELIQSMLGFISKTQG